MRPFFAYYGAKYQMSARYLPPQSSVVIEPFAGSACFSTRHDVPVAILYDANPDIVTLWKFLIGAKPSDIDSIPTWFEHNEQVEALPDGARHLVWFRACRGRAEMAKNLSPWYFQFRGETNARVWGPMAKKRIIEQLPGIRHWQVRQGDFTQSPVIPGAHWFVDPPYNNAAGRKYKIKFDRYDELAEWCKTRPGVVQVCENVGATWLPFVPVGSTNTSRGKRSGAVSREASWVKT